MVQGGVADFVSRSDSITYRSERVRELNGLHYKDPRATFAMPLGLLALEKEEEPDETEHP